MQAKSKPVPIPTPVTQPFWDAVQARRLRIQRCTACGMHVFYPRICCNFCGSRGLEWVEVSGRAVLHSYVINHVPAPGYEGQTPYVIAIVKLEEGPTMLSNIVGVPPDPARLPLDMPLEVDFEQRGTFLVPVFRPAGSAA